MSMSEISARKVTSLDVAIGMNIKRIRLAMCFTQAKLADGLGISFQAVQKYESGLNHISAARLINVAEVLNVNVGDLYEGIVGFQSTGLMDQFLRAADFRILHAFHAIECPKQKAALLKLAQSMSGGEVDDE